MKNFLLYAAGVVTGIAIGGYVFKKRYEEIMEEDRRSRKEVYEREASKEEKEESEQDSSDASVTDVNNYKQTIKENGYSGKVTIIDENTYIGDPEYEIINPMDFDTLDDFNAITLTLYNNDILCDDADEPMTEDEIDAAIGGTEAYRHFGEYEENAVYVRNYGRQVDYEILKVEEDYE